MTYGSIAVYRYMYEFQAHLNYCKFFELNLQHRVHVYLPDSLFPVYASLV